MAAGSASAECKGSADARNDFFSPLRERVSLQRPFVLLQNQCLGFGKSNRPAEHYESIKTLSATGQYYLKSPNGAVPRGGNCWAVKRTNIPMS